MTTITPVKERVFIGKAGKYQIPQGAKVQVVKFFPRRRALVEYEGKQILTFSTLLRGEPLNLKLGGRR